ncbi:unnamed protein product, partial [Didymodactylos carnosus]
MIMTLNLDNLKDLLFDRKLKDMYFEQHLTADKNLLLPSFIRTHISTNRSCCGGEKDETLRLKKVRLLKKQPTHLRLSFSSPVVKNEESKIKIQTQQIAPHYEENSLYNDIITNAWPVSLTYVENLAITNKRCKFSNEPVSIKPVHAIPGIGKKYGQILADHGFLYARQLLGYYIILKDGEMFRKWLEYKFSIPTFR